MKSAALCLGLALLAGCTPRSVGFHEISFFFAKPEFIPSRGIGADGWAEARRRQMLKSYIRAQGLSYEEHQLPLADDHGGKYRDTSIRLAGQGKTGIRRVSLSLKPLKDGLPDAEFRERQQSCDAALLASLKGLPEERHKWQSLEFLPTESCIDLTGQRTLTD